MQKEKQVAPVTLPEGRLKRSHKKMVATETPNVGAQPNIVKRVRKRTRWGVFRSEASGSTGVRPARSEVLASNNRGVLERGKQVVDERKGKMGVVNSSSSLSLWHALGVSHKFAFSCSTDSQSSDLVEVLPGMDRTAAQKRFDL